MTRKELMAAAKENPKLAEYIYTVTNKHYTNCSNAELKLYHDKYFTATEEVYQENIQTIESAVMSFLITLEQKGVLDILLAKIKG